MIEYCPTNEMLADMFTKPLQGITFCHFHAAVLNLPDDGEVCPTMVPMAGHRSVLGNELTTCKNRQTNRSISSERSKQMVKQMAKDNIGRKN